MLHIIQDRICTLEYHNVINVKFPFGGAHYYTVFITMPGSWFGLGSILNLTNA